MAEIEEELQGLLMKVKGESEQAAFKLGILKTKIRASGSITPRQIDGAPTERFLTKYLGRLWWNKVEIFL